MDATSEPDSEPHYLEVLYRDLALALGNAVWAFARIEWRTYEYLRRLSRDHLDEVVGDVAFRVRCSILRRLVERTTQAAEIQERALRAIREIEKLADRRNVIVHNPWSIWIDLDAGDFMTKIQKYSNRQNAVDLDQIKRFTAAAEAAERELRAALNAL